LKKCGLSRNFPRLVMLRTVFQIGNSLDSIFQLVCRLSTIILSAGCSRFGNYFYLLGSDFRKKRFLNMLINKHTSANNQQHDYKHRYPVGWKAVMLFHLVISIFAVSDNP